MQRIFVGDVQGCARELDGFLKWVRFDPSRDVLWCVGDIVNRGPDSLEALRLWRDVGGRNVTGNHDVYALLAQSGRRPRHKDTLDTLLTARDAKPLLDLLRQQPLLVYLPGSDGYRPAWVVHAGLDPRWGDLHDMAGRFDQAEHDDDWLESEEVDFATRVRCCDPNGERCSYNGPAGACPEPYRPWDDFYRGEVLVVHGHWARRGAYRRARTMGLDSSCVYGGLLTAWCQEEDRIVQIPSRELGGAPREMKSLDAEIR